MHVIKLKVRTLHHKLWMTLANTRPIVMLVDSCGLSIERLMVSGLVFS